MKDKYKKFYMMFDKRFKNLILCSNLNCDGWSSAELKLPNLSEDEILSIVEPIMDSCLEGSNEGDHKKHTKYFTNRMNSIVTPEELKRQ